MPNKKPIKVLYSKLGQYQAYGLAWPEDRVIAVDVRLRGVKQLDVLLHELLHVQNPDWPENEVKRKATELATILWRLGYRKVDNG